MSGTQYVQKEKVWAEKCFITLFSFFILFSLSMSSAPVFAEPEELYDLILDKTKQPGKDYVVVDVRDADYKVK